MDIIFGNSKLEKQCKSETSAKRKWGPDVGLKVLKRLEDILDSDNLGVLMKVPQAGCHPLTENRAGQWALKVGAKERLIFEPADDPVPTRENGTINIEEVTLVRILEVVDYHDPKEKRRKK